MNGNILDLLIFLIFCCAICGLFGIGYLLFIFYKKIKHRDNPIGTTEPFLNITY